MTAPGGGGPYGDQPGPWQQPYQHPPVDPQAPVNYPEYPYPTPYGSYPPPPPPYGYPSPPPYPGPYDPYQGYPVQQTNSLAQNFQLSVGGAPAVPSYYGLAQTAIGLYQFNLVVPSIPDNSAAPLTFSVGGTAGTQTLFTAVQN